MMRIATPPATPPPMAPPLLELFELVGAAEVVVEEAEEVVVEDEELVGAGVLVTGGIEGGPEANAPEPVNTRLVTGAGVPVTDFAADVKLAYWSNGALIAPTMPFAQCENGTVAWQKNHTGAEILVTVRLKVGGVFAFPGMRPLLNPPGSWTQGLSMLDCVTP